jgi:hypothetical protein
MSHCKPRHECQETKQCLSPLSLDDHVPQCGLMGLMAMIANIGKMMTSS